jgi:diadenosine tetraphosphate (Ap4A) HIT family hydrolase
MSCPLCLGKNENVIYKNELFRVILVDDIPGFTRIILNKHVAEFSDLSLDEAIEITKAIYKIEKAMIKHLRPDKVNIASLGNYVPHLHIHIIPRYKNDAWFPDSIWSQKHREYEYKTTQKQIQNYINEIKS